ncbi:MAG TPA: TlpA disulfide reductase family protein [Chloroflexaceae bacterium]|nr:TlpA disulfide reductase family protein [Chloroflexaceae bacterium]
MKQLIILATLALALAACGGAQPAQVPADLDIGDATIAAESRLLDAGGGKLVEGDMAPDFSYVLPDGTTRRLSDLRGTPVLINFWATWCLPCVEEMPALQQAYDGAGGELQVLAVNRNELPAAIARFAPQVGVSFPLIANIAGDIGDRYSVTSLPVSYFINSDGTIGAKHIGALTAQTLQERLDTLR